VYILLIAACISIIRKHSHNLCLSRWVNVVFFFTIDTFISGSCLYMIYDTSLFKAGENIIKYVWFESDGILMCNGYVKRK